MNISYKSTMPQVYPILEAFVLAQPPTVPVVKTRKGHSNVGSIRGIRDRFARSFHDSICVLRQILCIYIEIEKDFCPHVDCKESASSSIAVSLETSNRKIAERYIEKHKRKCIVNRNHDHN